MATRISTTAFPPSNRHDPPEPHPACRDRVLAGFREQAGLPAKAQHDGGWEARGINGHSLGHYLSGRLFFWGPDAGVPDPAKQRWDDHLKAAIAAAEERRRMLAAATIDSVMPGFQQSEVHNMQSNQN